VRCGKSARAPRADIQPDSLPERSTGKGVYAKAGVALPSPPFGLRLRRGLSPRRRVAAGALRRAAKGCRVHRRGRQGCAGRGASARGGREAPPLTAGDALPAALRPLGRSAARVAGARQARARADKRQSSDGSVLPCPSRRPAKAEGLQATAGQSSTGRRRRRRVDRRCEAFLRRPLRRLAISQAQTARQGSARTARRPKAEISIAAKTPLPAMCRLSGKEPAPSGASGKGRSRPCTARRGWRSGAGQGRFLGDSAHGPATRPGAQAESLREFACSGVRRAPGSSWRSVYAGAAFGRMRKREPRARGLRACRRLSRGRSFQCVAGCGSISGSEQSANAAPGASRSDGSTSEGHRTRSTPGLNPVRRPLARRAETWPAEFHVP